MSDQSAYKSTTYCSENQLAGYWFNSNPYFNNTCLEAYEIIKVEDYNKLITCIKEADYYLDAKAPKTHNGKQDRVTTPVNAIAGDQTVLNNNVAKYTIISYTEHFKQIKEALKSTHNINKHEIIYGSQVKYFKDLLDAYQLDPNLKHDVWEKKTCCDHCSHSSCESGGGCGCHWHVSDGHYGTCGYHGGCSGSGYFH